MRLFFFSWVLGIAMITMPMAYGEEAGKAVIAGGKNVKINYTLTVGGKVFDSSEGKAPLQYEQGKHQIIPGLEKALDGLKVGDEREIVVKPEEGYGAIDPKAFVEVPKSNMPKGDLTVGMHMRTMGEGGQPVSATISEIRKDTVLMDFNHPLAGKDLNFKVKVVEIT